MTHHELTQCLNLARALNLIVSSKIVNGVMYVYSKAGYAIAWDSFVADYPLERLQAMATRARIRLDTVG